MTAPRCRAPSTQVHWLGTLIAIFLAFPAFAEIRLPQDGGGELVLEAPAERVITLAPHLAELAWDAGAGDTLVGTVAWSDYPEPVTALPEIGDAFRFDLEQILALRPDLVIAWASGNPAPALIGLEDLGLPVWRTEIRQPAEIATLIEAIGDATGRDGKAEDRAGAVRERLAKLRESNAGRRPVSYFYQVAERPLYTVSGDHLVSHGLALCGGQNIFADLGELAPQVAAEAVIAADPEVMFAGRFEGSGEPLAHWREWPRLRAVKRDALFTLPAEKINRATPRMLDAVEEACKLLDDFRADSPQDSWG